ncbi:DUF4386 domain-containing protein [Arthrospiribacter ruber]|uniref:DUF4386 domain-containing protein n=1 Tax=Arthrospiribacter ruber TaxID=2487934 RepID=A0A951J663_9BACT|nr:DUF4386 domain-containing protein [Arthrospiribacter ruber]MBW3470477.1 DUF4386 domain-containing protein [Arthrospiribacter ruber]
MHTIPQNLVKTVRITGIWYLTLAISGVIGFLLIHPQVFIADDPTKTLENITQNTQLARVRLLLEFAIIISQALTAFCAECDENSQRSPSPSITANIYINDKLVWTETDNCRECTAENLKGLATSWYKFPEEWETDD